MCTVTIIPGRTGYRLGMNRDEKLTRPLGQPPRQRTAQGRSFIGPSEPGGGTWIGVNDHGVCLALINWYSVNRQVRGKIVSRGEIIPATRHAGDSESVDVALARLTLKRTNPFRLIGIFPASCTIVEWRWDLNRLIRVKHSWQAQQWISSGFDEQGAQRMRSKAFVTARQQRTFGGAEWLRRLHRSHRPSRGPFSMCMHRRDAATVSYTEVHVSTRIAKLRYHPGQPCENSRFSVHCIPLLEPARISSGKKL